MAEEGGSSHWQPATGNDDGFDKHHGHDDDDDDDGHDDDDFGDDSLKAGELICFFFRDHPGSFWDTQNMGYTLL